MYFLWLIMLICLSFGQTRVSSHTGEEVQSSLTLSELPSEVEKLKREVEDLKQSCHSARVAFSAVLRPPSQDNDGYGHHGPFNADTNLVHNHVLTNVGDAYNTASGAFTAPVNGVYSFTITTYSWVAEANIGVALYKNSEQVALIWEYQDKGDNEDIASIGVILQLVKGDTVTVVLPSGFKVTSNAYKNICTFNGFLIFKV
ncbi:hypothetical protein UPYG_G00235420 [Umbra pygmaea]|uniref:C1q domain-containing protein n=1 Tax=Umbra pygmaea TaxID=75934 RepID=A0ABD0WWH0_UMBPY